MTIVSTSALRFLRTLPVVTALVFCFLPLTAARADVPLPQPQFKKYALLVGCTKYTNPDVDELYGPANDIPMFAELLEKDFGFPRQNITTLVGPAGPGTDRPTYANIVKGFNNLIARADKDTQIVILMSGHGVQVPIPESQKDPLDPKNPEPDGLDEVFLPVDVESWEKGDLKNAIRDDQFGEWLDQFRAKGASVWIIFDCCHSGTMSRDARALERPREVPQSKLHIPAREIESAVQRAKEAVEKAQKEGKPNYPAQLPLAVPQAKKALGNVVAFYAAQPYETTPELPRPVDAPPTPKHYYGLLSYTLTSVLKEIGSPLSYAELSKILVARYQAERGARGPTPFFEGDDMDREVLGLHRWPKRSAIVLERAKGQLKVSAGSLGGLTPGSILAVHPAIGGKGEAEAVLGHVKVLSVTPGEAVVEPLAYDGKPAPKADGLPNLARCNIVYRDFGEMRIKIAIPDAREKTEQAVTARVRDALEQMGKEARGMIDLVRDENKAEWLLWVEGEKVYWRAGEGGKVTPQQDKLAVDTSRQMGRVVLRRIFGGYSADKVPNLTRRLERDVQTIFTWQNLWRVAGTLGNKAGTAGNYGLNLDVFRLKADGKREERPLLSGASLKPGDQIEYVLRNDGNHDLWVNLFVLSGDFGIDVSRDLRQIKAGEKAGPFSGTITQEGLGTEGFIVFAVPQEVSRGQPSFEFLAQEGLKATEGTPTAQRSRDVAKAPDTPFGRLLKNATLGKGAERGLRMNQSTNPAMLSWSWITLPPAAAARLEGRP